MGNLDRFFSVQGKSFIPWVNLGNVMLGELPSEAPDNAEVVFIDNPTFHGIMKIDSTSLEEKIREIQNANLPPRLKERKILFLREESKGNEYVPEIINSLNTLFCGVVNGSKREEFSAIIAQGLTDQAIKSLHEQDQPTASLLLTPYTRHLQSNIDRGIEKGIERLKNGFIPFIPQELGNHLSPAFLLLLRKNQDVISSKV